MNLLYDLLIDLNKLFSNLHLLMVAESIGLILKGYILYYLFKRAQKSSYVFYSSLFLSASIATSMITNVAWLLRLLEILNIIILNTTFKTILLKFAWGIYIIYYQALTLFLESLFKKSKNLNIFHKIISMFGIATSLFLTALLIRSSSNINLISKFTIGYIYTAIPISLLIIWIELKKNIVPKVIKKQIKLVAYGMLIPSLIFDFLQIYPLNTLFKNIGTNNYSMLGISTTVSIIMLFYCTKKMLTLRILNISPRLDNNYNALHFLDNFRDILHQLSKVNQIEEINYITKLFFEKALKISPNKVHLTLKNEAYLKSDQLKLIFEEPYIDLLKKDPILIRDDIELNNFYNETNEEKKKLDILNRSNSDIFCLITDKNSIIGHISIEKNSRENMHFSKLEHDQIAIFCNYIKNVIQFIEHKNLKELIKHTKELKDELYLKHQEVNKYKEGIRNIIKKYDRDNLGVIIYKNKQFNLLNKEAKNIINYNLNQVDGHPVAKKIKDLLKIVLESNTVQVCLVKDSDNQTLKITGIPVSEGNKIIFILHYPEISETVKQNLDLIQNPSDWDYALYLETTESGKLINQIIPANTETFYNFKIDLIKIALSNKALLLKANNYEVETISEIIKKVSLKNSIHTIELTDKEKNGEFAIQLFGINPIFGINEMGVLKKLDNEGIILIKNIHLLSLDTQETLSEYIQYGFFKIYKGHSTVSANARIICTSHENLQSLVEKGKFSINLYKQLQKTNLKMPSLLNLADKEAKQITNNLIEELIKQDGLKNILGLTEKEKEKLLDDIPTSLFEYKQKINSRLQKKRQKIQIPEENIDDQEFNLSDPILLQASRLGKKALKDPEILNQLCIKLKNQNTIAKFLGVNRSSVSRRFKEYKINID